MKNLLTSYLFKCSVIFIFMAAPFLSVAQKNNIIYLDESNNIITKQKYNKRSNHRNNLSIEYSQNDTTIHKLVNREEKGKIEKDGMEILRKYLEKCTGTAFSPDEVIVLIYYPGKDPCNSSRSGNADKTIIKQNYNNLKEELNKWGNVHLAHIYKNPEGLKSQKKIIPWHPDIDQGIEELFFKYHYPCSSFVVINTTGDYHAYFGEYATSYMIDIVKAFQ